MSLRSVIAVFITTLVLFSCSKDESTEKPGQTSDTVTYQPVTPGSAWHYKNGLNANGGFTLTATGKDTLINGISFSVFDNKPDTSSGSMEAYFGQDGDDYYALGLLNNLGDSALNYLRDKAVNTAWQQTIAVTYQGFSADAQLNFTLAQAGISKEINGRTYTKVAHVTVQAQVEFSGTLINYATGDFYFSRGVGLVAAQIRVGNAAVADISLDDFSIK